MSIIQCIAKKLNTKLSSYNNEFKTMPAGDSSYALKREICLKQKAVNIITKVFGA